MKGTMIALRKAQKEVKQLRESEGQWETHWTFLRDWLNENVDNNLAAKRRILKVMDELRPRGDDE